MQELFLCLHTHCLKRPLPERTRPFVTDIEVLGETIGNVVHPTGGKYKKWNKYTETLATDAAVSVYLFQGGGWCRED